MAIGRDLVEKSEGFLTAVALVLAPGDNFFVVLHHLLVHGKTGVAVPVIAIVDVEAEHTAIAGEGMIVATLAGYPGLQR